MINLPESTLNLLLSGLMGIFGGLIVIPISALVSWRLKQDELLLKHRLDLVAKRQELLLQHTLERNSRSEEFAEMKAAIARLEKRSGNG
jgi:hypothetical protein